MGAKQTSVGETTTYKKIVILQRVDFMFVVLTKKKLDLLHHKSEKLDLQNLIKEKELGMKVKQYLEKLERVVNKY